jgi:NADH:ubiquinone oxidoreductase subunit 6 (subunit J)
MVMFLFVIAYLGGRADAPWAGGTRLIQASSVIAAAAVLAVTLVAVLLDVGDRLSDEADIDRAFGTPAEIGRLFLTDHLLAFEITSIVLLVAAIGGVVLGMRSEAEDDVEAQS